MFQQHLFVGAAVDVWGWEIQQNILTKRISLEIAYLRRHQIEALCWEEDFIVSFKLSFFISALWTTNWEKWGLNQFKRSILITISDTLDENEGCNHPDHWEEVEGHDGIGDGSGVDWVFNWGEITSQKWEAWQWFPHFSAWVKFYAGKPLTLDMALSRQKCSKVSLGCLLGVWRVSRSIGRCSSFLVEQQENCRMMPTPSTFSSIILSHWPSPLPRPSAPPPLHSQNWDHQ